MLVFTSQLTEVQSAQRTRRIAAEAALRQELSKGKHFGHSMLSADSLPEDLGSVGTRIGTGEYRYVVVKFEGREVPIMFKSQTTIEELVTQLAGPAPKNEVYTRRFRGIQRAT